MYCITYKIPYFKSIKIRGVNLLCIACYSDAVRLISRKVSEFLDSMYEIRHCPSKLKCLCVCSHMLFIMCFVTSNLLLQTLSHLVQAHNSKSDINCW